MQKEYNKIMQDGQMPWHFKHGVDIASFQY